MANNPLEGVSEKSTKAELWSKLTSIGSELTRAERKLQKAEEARQKETADALQTIEERIRNSKAKTSPTNVMNVIVTTTPEELKETHEFFEDFKDLHDHLPIAVQRLIVGVDTLLHPDKHALENVA